MIILEMEKILETWVSKPGKEQEVGHIDMFGHVKFEMSIMHPSGCIQVTIGSWIHFNG